MNEAATRIHISWIKIRRDEQGEAGLFTPLTHSLCRTAALAESHACKLIPTQFTLISRNSGDYEYVHNTRAALHRVHAGERPLPSFRSGRI